MRAGRLGWLLLLVLACLISSCVPGSTSAHGDAVLDKGGANEYYFIPTPEPHVSYSWGLPLLTTKHGHHVRLTAIRLLHAPREVHDMRFVRIKFADMGTGIGIIKTPAPATPDTNYRPEPAVGATYGDVDEYQILLEFSLSASVVGDLSGIQITYVDGGRTRTQRIPALLKLGRSR